MDQQESPDPVLSKTSVIQCNSFYVQLHQVKGTAQHFVRLATPLRLTNTLYLIHLNHTQTDIFHQLVGFAGELDIL